MRDMKPTRSLVLFTAILALTGVGLTGCMKDSPKQPTANKAADLDPCVDVAQAPLSANPSLEEKVIKNIANSVIMNSYCDLRNETLALHKAALVLQAAPTESNLTMVAAQWRKSRVPWERTEGFLFGPVHSLGVDPAIDTWPLAIHDLEAILANPTGLTTEKVRTLGINVQGFHTAEYLIFGDGKNGNSKSIAAMTPTQLQYLATVTEVLSEQTLKLFTAWNVHHDPEDASSPSYLTVIANPDPDNNRFYPSEKSIFQEYVRGMIKIAAEVGGGKISTPLASGKTSEVESQFSWNSLEDFQDNVRSLRSIYTGDYTSANGKKYEGPGIDDLVLVRVANGAALDKRIKSEIDAAEAAIGAIGGGVGMSFTKAIGDQNGKVRSQAAVDALGKLERTLTDDLLPLMR